MQRAFDARLELPHAPRPQKCGRVASSGALAVSSAPPALVRGMECTRCGGHEIELRQCLKRAGLRSYLAVSFECVKCHGPARDSGDRHRPRDARAVTAR